MKFRLYRCCCVSSSSSTAKGLKPNHRKALHKTHAAKEIDCKVTHFYSIKEMFPYFIYINMVFQWCNT